MITMFIACASAAGCFAALHYGAHLGTGWSVFASLAAFVAVQATIGVRLRRSIKAVMDEVQRIMLGGREKIDAKVRRWQFRPPGSVKAAQLEIERDTREFTLEALKATEKLRKLKYWMPFLERQIATAQFQLCWILKDFDKVDELLPKAFVAGPEMTAMKLARMQMRGEPVEAIRKVYDKSAKRARYNGNVLADACFSWILVKRGLVDDAFKVLTAALKKSDNQFLKANHEHLMNNRVTHFTNSGFGEQWYSLFLEEPKIKTQKQRPVYR